MIFGFLALLQGTLVCLGDMFYLGVQCEHPIQFFDGRVVVCTGVLEYCVYADPVVR